MKRYLTIFSLYAQHALEYKSKSLVWFLLVLIDAMVYLLYWRGVLTVPESATFWTLPRAMSYYLLLLVAGSFLQVHIEEEVAFEDIQQGRLSQYMLRPFSYLGFKFFQELPWRFIQGGFGLGTLIGISIFVQRIDVVTDFRIIPFVFLLVVGAYFLCFIYKMIVGIIAFWTTDFSGLMNIQIILFLLFSGILVPLHLLPDGIRSFALVQPLAYVLYYPVLAVQGSLTFGQILNGLFMQCIYIALLFGVYRLLWTRGIREFTAVGQ